MSPSGFTPGNFRVAFHAGEDLHLVGMVAGLGGTTEQVHLSAAGWGTAKRARFQHAGRAFSMDCRLRLEHEDSPSNATPIPTEILHRSCSNLSNVAHRRMTGYVPLSRQTF
jgi:hypothetical protein